MIYKLLLSRIKPNNNLVNNVIRRNNSDAQVSSKFETVFSLPAIKYISLLQRLKTYHIFATSIAVPGCSILEYFSVIPDYTFLSASYIGLTGAAVLSIMTIPFNNVIGFLYISEDNKYIKISSIDFWGKRNDKIVHVKEWIPLLDLPPQTMDAIYLSPKLIDGSRYKFLLRYGNVLNSEKIGQVLE